MAKTTTRYALPVASRGEWGQTSSSLSLGQPIMGSATRGYGVILADPPWTWKTWSIKGSAKSASQYYSTMEQGDLIDMPVNSLAASDSVLCLWVLNSMLDRGLELMSAWGFTYKTVGFCWTKTNPSGRGLHMGLGYHTRQNIELCLLGTKGKPKRMSGGVHQVIMSPRREHSRKPDEIYTRIERLVDGAYLEMFARQRWPGWDQWGDQTDKFEATSEG